MFPIGVIVAVVMAKVMRDNRRQEEDAAYTLRIETAKRDKKKRSAPSKTRDENMERDDNPLNEGLLDSDSDDMEAT